MAIKPIPSLYGGRASGRRAAVSANNRALYLPAPVGGLNLRDPIIVDKPQFASVLHNWIVQDSRLLLRAGSVEYAATESPVNSLIAFEPNSGYKALLANVRGNLYRVTNGSATLFKSFSGFDDNVYSCKFANEFNSFLVLCGYGKGVWTVNASGTIAESAITGVTSANLEYPWAWKGRLWFTERNSTRVWYLPYGSIQGEATAFDVGPFLKSGGNVDIGLNWTIDGGAGIDDYLVFVSKRGDVAIYQGSDPDTDVQIVGVWQAGAVPDGKRYFADLGSDVIFLTAQGLVSMRRLMTGQIQESFVLVENKLAREVSERLNRAWQLVVDRRNDAVWIFTPYRSNGLYQQYAINIHTLAVTTHDIPAVGGIVFNDRLYGAGDSAVLTLNSGANGAIDYPVTGRILYRPSDYKMQARRKRWHMVKPLLQSVNPPSVSVNLLVDLQYEYPGGTGRYWDEAYSLWDSALWDSAVWSDPNPVRSEWIGLRGMGTLGSLGLQVQSETACYFEGCNVIFEPGGIL